MRRKDIFFRVIGIIGGFLVLFLMASTIDKRTIGYRVDEIDVEIENAYENFFIDESDVMALVMKNEGDSILGDQFGRVSLKKVEARIESHSFVKDAEVYRDLKGHLIIKATQNKPIARIIGNNGRNSYIAEDGGLLPVSPKYTARVPVITGSSTQKLFELENMLEDEYGSGIYHLIKFINNETFWTMQIGEIVLEQNQHVVMYPQVGDQRLEFGLPTDIEKKFSKLKIFFKQIMPTKGWNTYERVNVAFKDQIICE